ncbi:hypothetical protein BYT27DRAFT_7261281 [Phlegmacium glaucopus]|nr:hypothetical protein BYT27DRAFT_7261281 [Phlegmacium glaucopus]
MDPLYNKEKAVEALKKATQERMANVHSGLQVAKMFEGDMCWSSHTAIQVGAVWHLVYTQAAGEDGGGPEEVVASLHGIICNADLPPFRERISIGNKQIKYIRQSVTLIAFGDPMFDAVGVNIAKVHALLGRIVGADRLQECSMYMIFDGTL